MKQEATLIRAQLKTPRAAAIAGILTFARAVTYEIMNLYALKMAAVS